MPEIRGLYQPFDPSMAVDVVNAIRNALPVVGTFTLSAGTSTVVAEARVRAASVVQWMPTSSAGAALLGGMYLSARTAGTGFTLTHATAAGSETMQYVVHP